MQEIRLKASHLCFSASPLAGTEHELALVRGQRVWLRGDSGSGKTSLLRALVALHPYLSGNLEVSGDSLSDLGAPYYRQRVCLVPQRPSRPEGSVTKWLQMVQSYRPLSGDFETRLRGFWSRLDLPDPAADTLARELSEGEWHRLVLGVALALQPDVLLLDEPTAALDRSRSEHLVQAMEQDCERRGTAVLWSGHDDLLEPSSTAVWTVNAGRIEEDRT